MKYRSTGDLAANDPARYEEEFGLDLDRPDDPWEPTDAEFDEMLADVGYREEPAWAPEPSSDPNEEPF